MPRRGPTLTFRVVQVDEAGDDEAIDPCARVGVQINDEVVGWTGRRRNEDDDSNEPVKEELSNKSDQSVGRPFKSTYRGSRSIEGLITRPKPTPG